MFSGALEADGGAVEPALVSLVTNPPHAQHLILLGQTHRSPQRIDFILSLLLPLHNPVHGVDHLVVLAPNAVPLADRPVHARQPLLQRRAPPLEGSEHVPLAPSSPHGMSRGRMARDGAPPMGRDALPLRFGLEGEDLEGGRQIAGIVRRHDPAGVGAIGILGRGRGAPPDGGDDGGVGGRGGSRRTSLLGSGGYGAALSRRRRSSDQIVHGREPASTAVVRGLVAGGGRGDDALGRRRGRDVAATRCGLALP
mmetsp:Transcript_23933/g.57732  ORF Transcript_23933/g.57732 Transcript_23933/m.57732 type:complete len:253 (+) Transcript_23933:1307-2065(+)